MMRAKSNLKEKNQEDKKGKDTSVSSALFIFKDEMDGLDVHKKEGSIRLDGKRWGE